MERYNGVGNPPVCIMTLRPVFDVSATPDLTLPVILDGVKQPLTITLNRRAETPAEGGIRQTSEEFIKSPGQLLCMNYYQNSLFNLAIVQLELSVSVKFSITRKG